MEKVFRVYSYECEGDYERSYESTIGIFTDKTVAGSILSKLEKDKEEKLDKYNIEAIKVEKELSHLTYEERFHYNHSEEYEDLIYEARKLEYTNYHIETITLNKLRYDLLTNF